MPEGIVLRYGLLYGRGHLVGGQARLSRRRSMSRRQKPAVLALTKAKPDIYNIAEDDGYASSHKAKRDFGFRRSSFRLMP